MNTASPTNTGGHRLLVLLYALLLTINQISIIWQWEPGIFVSKILLMPVLLFYFLIAGKTIGTLQKWLIGLALLASWAGDILLLFDATDPLYFMLGLGSFLLAHIFYTIYFKRIGNDPPKKNRLWVAVLIGVYYATLLYILTPFLGDLTWPVRIYGLIISAMLLTALYAHMQWRNRATFLMAFGAMLFVISDSLLAINKFYSPFPFAGVAVMCTYGVAQLFIVEGVLLSRKA